MKKLFWDKPYMKECKATVEKIDGRKVILNQSIIFAFSGGQITDKGKINGIEVEKAENGDPVVYTLEEEPDFSEGDSVKIEIDFESRYKVMKLHSAAHVVYEIFTEIAGKRKIIGSNISFEKARIDFEMDENLNEYIPEIKKKVEEIIENDLEIKTYEDKENKEKRWWEIPEKWKMPCGGTHVKKTGEIGKLNLKRVNIGAGKERVEVTLI